MAIFKCKYCGKEFKGNSTKIVNIVVENVWLKP